MQKKPRGRPKQPKTIELDPNKDYIIVVPGTIAQEQYDQLCLRYQDKSNVVVIASDNISVISIR